MTETAQAFQFIRQFALEFFLQVFLQVVSTQLSIDELFGNRGINGFQ